MMGGQTLSLSRRASVIRGYYYYYYYYFPPFRLGERSESVSL